jgi:hypothetical protein
MLKHPVLVPQRTLEAVWELQPTCLVPLVDLDRELVLEPLKGLVTSVPSEPAYGDFFNGAGSANVNFNNVGQALFGSSNSLAFP